MIVYRRALHNAVNLNWHHTNCVWISKTIGLPPGPNGFSFFAFWLFRRLFMSIAFVRTPLTSNLPKSQNYFLSIFVSVAHLVNHETVFPFLFISFLSLYLKAKIFRFFCFHFDWHEIETIYDGAISQVTHPICGWYSASSSFSFLNWNVKYCCQFRALTYTKNHFGNWTFF